MGWCTAGRTRWQLMGGRSSLIPPPWRGGATSSMGASCFPTHPFARHELATSPRRGGARLRDRGVPKLRDLLRRREPDAVSPTVAGHREPRGGGGTDAGRVLESLGAVGADRRHGEPGWIPLPHGHEFVPEAV